MTFFRDLLADLISKRLWPVALALVVALVAVPVVLSKPAPHVEEHSAEAEAAMRAAQAAAQTEPIVSLTAAPKGRTHRLHGLDSRDPFKQRHLPQASKAGALEGGAGGVPESETTVTPPAEAPKHYTLYGVDLRFGEAGAQRTRRDLPRLTALPSSSDPVVVFLGVLKDGNTAVFMVISEAAADGDGTCKPDKKNCAYVYLQEGETEFLDVAAGTAGLVQYELKLNKIRKHVTTSAGIARRAYLRESIAGRDILRAEVGRVSRDLRYSPDQGVIDELEDE